MRGCGSVVVGVSGCFLSWLCGSSSPNWPSCVPSLGFPDAAACVDQRVAENRSAAGGDPAAAAAAAASMEEVKADDGPRVQVKKWNAVALWSWGPTQ